MLLGLASLVHIVMTTLRRRQRELATLRTLGLTPRQTVGCIVWQAVTVSAIGLVVGVPLGLIAGRYAWWAVADPIGVVTDINRPWLGATLVCAGALAAAVVLAAPTARATSRRTPAIALRAE